MTRYKESFSWKGTIQNFLDEVITESPILNVCSGTTRWGDVTVDLYEPADVRADWINLPFEDNSFGAVFADPPWDRNYMKDCSDFVKEALRIAPVAYLMSPWIYCAAWVNLTNVWYREIPGVNIPILLTRYVKKH